MEFYLISLPAGLLLIGAVQCYNVFKSQKANDLLHRKIDSLKLELEMIRLLLMKNGQSEKEIECVPRRFEVLRSKELIDKKAVKNKKLSDLKKAYWAKKKEELKVKMDEKKGINGHIS